MKEPGQIAEVEVEELGAWTTGYSEEAGSVALVLRSVDGTQFGVIMTPDEALKMGASLSKVGLQVMPAAKA